MRRWSSSKRREERGAGGSEVGGEKGDRGRQGGT